MGFLSYAVGLFFFVVFFFSLCFSVFVLVPYSLNYCSFVVSSGIKKPDSSSLLFFLKIVLAISGLLCFHTNCNFFLFQFCEKWHC